MIKFNPKYLIIIKYNPVILVKDIKNDLHKTSGYCCDEIVFFCGVIFFRLRNIAT